MGLLFAFSEGYDGQARKWRLMMADGSTSSPQDNLENAIRDNAAGPAKASGDGTSVEQHSLADQIAADKYLASKRAGRNPAGVLTRVKIVPPGSA